MLLLSVSSIPQPAANSSGVCFVLLTTPAMASSQWLLPLLGEELCHVVMVLASGGMLGTAILFPLANVEGLGFRAV